MRIERHLLRGLAVVLLLAPLPFGSARPLATAILLAACFGLGVLWVAWRSRRGLSPLPWTDPVLWAGALLALVGAVQLLPLPPPALELLSPMASELRARYEPEAPPAPASAGRGAWRPASLHPWATRQSSLKLAAYVIVALITIELAARESCRRALAVVLVGSGGFQALYGLAEYFSGRQHVFGYAKKYYTDVATGTFINRNHFAGYLEMTLPLAIALAALAISRLRTGRGAPLSEQLARASSRELFSASTLLILALTMAIALVCSRSRMGIASAFFALLATGIFLAWRGRGRSFATAAVVVTGATLLLFGQGDSSPIIERFLRAANELRGGLGRWTIWSQAADMALAFPVLGIGLGAFRHVFPAYRSTGAGTSLAHAHNDYLQFFAETGAVGCALALAGLVLVGCFTLRRAAGRPDFGHLGHAAAAGVAALGFHSMTDFNLAIPSNALTLAVLLGIAICWMRIPAPALAEEGRAGRRWLLRACAPAVAMVALLLLAVAPVVAVERSERVGLEGLSALEALAGAGPRAVRLLGWLDADNAERLFEEAAGIGNAAIRDLQVLLRARQSGVSPSTLAVRYVERRLQKAIALQAAGLRHLPVSSRGHLGMGRLRAARCAAASLAAVDQAECVLEAIPQFRAALELSPMSAATHARAARFLIANWSLLDQGGRSQARSMIERAVAMNANDRELSRSWLAILDRQPPAGARVAGSGS